MRSPAVTFAALRLLIIRLINFLSKKNESVGLITQGQMAQTQSLVFARLPDCLAGVVIGYFRQMPVIRNSYSIYNAVEFGLWEECRDYMIENSGLWCIFYRACFRGYIDIVKLAIAYGANNWDHGLHSACQGGHLDIAEFMIELGACRWNYGLYGACRENKSATIALMLAKGATSCSYCHGSMIVHQRRLKN